MIPFLDILGSPLFDGDRLVLLGVRLLLDLLIVGTLVFGVYNRRAEDSQGYVFTFITFNLVIFFICYLLSAVELSLGFAFGLFALFSILRYRTVTINIREMAFLFVVISVGLINALPYKQLSWVELLAIDAFLLFGTAILHNSVYKVAIESIVVRYERLALIAPERREELLADLSKRTGMEVRSIKIENISFMTDSADIRIYISSKGVSALPKEP